MEHIGDRLKKIRLEKGLSLEEVHKRTKIHINVLRAIEDDSFVNLNPVYVKGFLKIYCQFLGENPADYISDYREPRQRVVVSGEQPAQVRQLRQPVPAPAPLPHGVPAGRRFSLPHIPLPSLRLLRLLAAAVLGLAVLVLAVRLVSAGVRAWKASAQKRPAAVAAAAKRPAARPAAAKPAAEPAAAPIAAAALKAPASDTSVVRLGIRAKEDCWLQVRVDGKTVFQSVLNRGRLEGWQASNRIELTLGDAGKVDLEVNGSRIPALGRKGQPVKNILITRDGLKVGK